MTTTGVSSSITEHLLQNMSAEDYNTWVRLSDAISFDTYPKIQIDESKLQSYLVDKVLNNIELANKRVSILLEKPAPSCGDFVKIGDKYLRLAIPFGEGVFQYTEAGSFHVSSRGTVSYSGGFCFDYGDTITADSLIATTKLRPGSFWFFSNNDVKGGNGVYFTGNFKVWTLK